MKYYICPECGDMTTDEAINESCEAFGMGGMCDCRYIVQEWDEEYDGFEPVYMREYIMWVEIPERIHNMLKGENNTVLRLRNYKEIPQKVLDECKVKELIADTVTGSGFMEVDYDKKEKVLFTDELLKKFEDAIKNLCGQGEEPSDGDYPTPEELEELMDEGIEC